MTAKTVEFRVLVKVEDHGELDEGTIRDAIHLGFDIAAGEGYLTRLDDESTIVVGYTVSHVGTRED